MLRITLERKCGDVRVVRHVRIRGYLVTPSRILSGMWHDHAKVWVSNKTLLFLGCWAVKDLGKVIGFR